MSPNRFSVNSKQQNPTLAQRDQAADEALANRYDGLNQVFSEAEKHLKMLKPLHAVWVSYNHRHHEGGMSECEVLGIAKHLGKWRLCHAYDSDVDDDCSLEIKPIVECPVDVRVRAAKIVRQLHEEIIKSKEEFIPQVDEAIKELTDLCSNVL